MGLSKYRLLHSFVGCTADVAGDRQQVVRKEACHHTGQIDLEPQLKVFRHKIFIFRSDGCQGQVQDDVSHCWVTDEGDVFLENERIYITVEEDNLKSFNNC